MLACLTLLLGSTLLLKSILPALTKGSLKHRYSGENVLVTF